MIIVCIYARNRGLGKCVGPVTKVKVARKQTTAWQGLHDLAERLKARDEEPGVCHAHEQRAGENGFLLDLATPLLEKSVRRGGRDLEAAPPERNACASEEGDH